MLVSLVPALMLLASGDGLGGLLASYGSNAGCCWRGAGDNGKGNQPLANSAFCQASRRWGRRLDPQPGSGGFAPLAVLAGTGTVLPDLAVVRFELPLANRALAQGWQFHWRTALEPRAPSLVS